MELVSMIIPVYGVEAYSWRMSGNSVKSDLQKFRNHFN